MEGSGEFLSIKILPIQTIVKDRRKGSYSQSDLLIKGNIVQKYTSGEFFFFLKKKSVEFYRSKI